MTSQEQAAGEHVPSSKRQHRWAAVIAAALVLGVGVGWFYTRSAGLPRSAYINGADSIAKLVIVLATTLSTCEVVRLGRQLGFWRASIGMLPSVLVAYSRALPPHRPTACGPEPSGVDIRHVRRAHKTRAGRPPEDDLP